MKVEVNSQALADAVAWTTRVIDARPASPILAGIRLEAIDGTLQLSAFNYAISARHHIEAGVDESGSILVLGKLLADITKSLPAAKTYLSTDGSTLTITSGKSTFTMQLMPDNEYPDLPVVPAKLGQVDAQTFAQAVAQASVAVSREENRPVLTGIRVQFQGNKVIMSSTDRFRLSRSSFTWTPENPDINTTALVRGALLRDVARSLDEHQNIVVDFDPLISRRYGEEVKHVTLLNITGTAFYVVMNQERYDSLPDDLKAIVDDMSQNYGPNLLEKFWAENVYGSLDKWIKDMGGTVHVLSDEDYARADKLAAVPAQAWFKSLDKAGYRGAELEKTFHQLEAKYFTPWRQSEAYRYVKQQ